MRTSDEERAYRLATGRVISAGALSLLLQVYASGRPEIEAIWLFGSQAQGRARPTSDLDLAFQVTPRPVDAEELAYRSDRTRELEELLGIPVDAVILSPELPLPLLWEILHYPTVLFERAPEAALAYGSYLRGLCRDQWPRLTRRHERTRRWFESVTQHASLARPG